MIFVNEWLPNPVGADAAGEWVELFNSGQYPVSLAGWSLKTGSGKKIFLKNERIDAGSYLVLKRSDTKLTIRNTSESIFLYNDKGILVDQSEFLGSAPEGKSFARISGAGSPRGAQNFIFAEPTPGAPNRIISGQSFLMNNVYPFQKPLNNSWGYEDVFATMVSFAFLLAFFITILLKRNDHVSELFFGRD